MPADETTDGSGADLLVMIAQAIERMRADREHGAAWLARQAADLLARLTADAPHADHVQQIQAVHTAAVALAAARPSMAALANTAAAIWHAGSGAPNAELRLAAMDAAAERLRGAWDTAAAAISRHAHPLLGPVVYTLSRSGTVEAVLERLARDTGTNDTGADEEGGPRLRQVIVSESRPGGEGLAAADGLARAGLAVTFVPDAACGIFIGEASAVALGADSVRADGGVVNKVGSYPLALVAREAGIPVYVLCETLKLAAPDFPLVLEPLEWSEIAARLPAGVAARSVAFELVPARLISGIVTEEGVLSAAQVAQRARVAGEALADLWSTP
jgi:translation initiation factor 2B subunit (eIF-2B alpha/beta/delta family)